MESTADPCPPVDESTCLERTVRRHLHDVRNCINGLDLEAALLLELVTDLEAIESIHRIRWQVGQLEAISRSLAVRIARPQRVSLTASDLLQLWKSQVASLEDPSRPFQWSAPLAPKRIEVDVAAITSVLRELMVEAVRKPSEQALEASVRTTELEVIAELRFGSQSLPLAGDWLEEIGRLVALSQGRFTHAVLPATGQSVATLAFPVAID